eukprot:CAMPEP_0119264302 /NCGR_PEP_ID=MMETSP1329-20130426/3426_1 /TAXON_ID=114041 /ORGANISM="Genus nov. species nov., Strain RCC1024" /LENGTH=60 /DNA_ID=CAMNT_0007264057 /DNA_START=95 /DNA_END=273 /DNA_ORIENTATION=+
MSTARRAPKRDGDPSARPTAAHDGHPRRAEEAGSPRTPDARRGNLSRAAARREEHLARDG